ncbi:MAG: hypothetical protein M1838_003436 [Thelocarpon superellum]|nr:MAG: hypothetical protein M1838_003436 [Thelocarpon superellum]
MSGLNRFLSRREKRGNGTQERRPWLVSGDLYGLFSAESKGKPGKDEEKKIKAVSKKLARLGISSLKQSQIEYALRSKDTDGDPDKAFDLLVVYEDALEGIIYRYDPTVRLLGAENRQHVTCFLDALLFAMFARLATFEAILYKPFAEKPKQMLATVLRLWVNLLRKGRLITVDVTGQLQEALAACGWKEAALMRQQDASEAFTFIAETLELPHLTLKMDIFHTGKEDAADDHKLVNERLLEVAIPRDVPDGSSITLEECLETYFNNRIEVRRHMERRATVDAGKGFLTQVDTAHSDSDVASPSTPLQASPVAWHPLSPSALHPLSRTASIIQERVVTEEGQPSDGPRSSPTIPFQPGHQRKSSIRKEVMMPAWQFFSLIPWYTSSTPTTNAQVAAHFSTQRPVLGLCLKRYSILSSGGAVRLGAQVDIPLEIGLPHFIQDDNPDEGGALFGNFKLVLQSVVCHRGISVDAGHYIALIRAHTSAGGDNLRSNGGSGEDQWMRFDDLAVDGRVEAVDIHRALLEESPYLLFYQVQPIDGPSAPEYDEAPPAYSARRDGGSEAPAPAPAPEAATAEEASRPLAGYDWSRKGTVEVGGTTDPPSRTSISSEPPAVVVAKDDVVDMDGLRHDPAWTELPRTTEENGMTLSSLSRRSSGSHRVPSKSRQPSQSGEGRLSATFLRLAERMSRDKLDTSRAPASGEAEVPDALGQASTDDGVASAASPAEARGWGSKEKKRGLSRNRRRPGGSDPPLDGVPKVPDRECVLM